MTSFEIFDPISGQRRVGYQRDDGSIVSHKIEKNDMLATNCKALNQTAF